jgi:hypothetical protein
MVRPRVQPYHSDFGKKIKTNIKKTDRPILLDPYCFINLR